MRNTTNWTVPGGLKAFGYRIGKTTHKNSKQESSQRCNIHPSNKSNSGYHSPPNNRHLFEIETGECATSEGASAMSEGANRGGTIAVRVKVC